MGTLAHNTVRINKTNQALIAGPTMWLEHYKTKIIKTENNRDRDIVIASHNGYVNFGVKHTRTFIFDKIKKELYIKDILEKKGNKEIFIEIPFHIHPSVEVNDNQQKLIELTIATRKCLLKADDKLQTKIIKGQAIPELNGWYSPSFLRKEAATVIYNYGVLENSTTFENIIKVIDF